MLYIHCPWCGDRPHYEFSYEGDATVDSTTELYLRTNPAGLHVEFWHHRDGCQLWLRVTRDTVTQAVHTVDIVGEEPIT